MTSRRKHEQGSQGRGLVWAQAPQKRCLRGATVRNNDSQTLEDHICSGAPERSLTPNQLQQSH